jgi:hypothetical protein
MNNEAESLEVKIRTLVRRLRLTDAMAQEMIDEGLTYEEAFDRACGAVGSGVQIGQTSEEKSAAALEEAIEHKLCGNSLREFAAKNGDVKGEISSKSLRIHGNPYAGMSLLGMVEKNHRAKGGRFGDRSYLPDNRVNPMALAGMFIDCGHVNQVRGPGIGSAEWNEEQRARRSGEYQQRGGGGITKSDVPNALANVLRKVVFTGYLQNAQEWKALARLMGVPDFRPQSFRRGGHVGVLPTLPEGATIPFIAPGDSINTDVQIDKHAGQISVSREALLNDNTGLIKAQALDAGKAQALTVQKALFDLLLHATPGNPAGTGLGPTMPADSLPFFDASHLNVSPDGELTKETLDADRYLLKAQKSPSNGLPLGLAPSVLLVPAALEGAAMDAAGMRFAADARAVSKVIATPWLTGTRRYLLADPEVAAAFVVAFYGDDSGNFNESPAIEMVDLWNHDAVGYKVRLDFRVVAWEFLAAVTNSGASPV